jgi:serine/threonine protein kinase
MGIDSVDDLIDVLGQVQLLDPGQMDMLVMSLRDGFTEPADLADDLVRKRWLTPFQAREVLQGRAGELTLGSYVLVDRLGEGGMAVVFRGRHRLLDRIDALKIIRPECLNDPRALHCFQQEAEAVSRLSHPNVVTLYEAGQDHGRHFLALEYVDGIDLERLVRKGGPLPVPEACTYARQAALGLEHACEHGVVLRDVKPHNLLRVAGTDLIKILDMGVALLRDQAGAGDRPAGPPGGRSLMGTPDYVAPEQVRDPWAVDSRADIYSLGCTLYFLLAGRAPFKDLPLEEKLRCHQESALPSLEERRPDLPPELTEVIQRMTAKHPQDRYQTPLEAAWALEPFCQEPLG